MTKESNLAKLEPGTTLISAIDHVDDAIFLLEEKAKREALTRPERQRLQLLKTAKEALFRQLRVGGSSNLVGEWTLAASTHLGGKDGKGPKFR